MSILKRDTLSQIDEALHNLSDSGVTSDLTNGTFLRISLKDTCDLIINDLKDKVVIKLYPGTTPYEESAESCEYILDINSEGLSIDENCEVKSFYHSISLDVKGFILTLEGFVKDDGNSQNLRKILDLLKENYTE